VALLFLFVGFALSVSFYCSLLEASLLASRNSTLLDRQRRGSVGAGKLLDIKRTRLDDAISAILILNTLANTLGATLAGAQAARVFGRTWVGLFSGVLTLLILVVSEIIPKTIGAVYTDRLSGAVGWSLSFLTRAMMPALYISRALTRLLTRGRRSGLSRSEFAAVIASATSEGVISRDESKIFANLLRFNEVQVEDVMTPRTVTVMMPEDTTVEQLLASLEARGFSRIPLYRGNEDNVVGYALLNEVLHAVARGSDRQQPLSAFARPISIIPELATVESALRQLIDRHEHIAIVTDEHGGVSGLVTLEDLTETILGVEIVDESDRVVDMRQAAVSLRDKRLERLRRERQLPGPEPAG